MACTSQAFREEYSVFWKKKEYTFLLRISHTFGFQSTVDFFHHYSLSDCLVTKMFLFLCSIACNEAYMLK